MCDRGIVIVLRDWSLFRFGGDLLSHTLRCSTIGATALNCRVRDGIGCFARAMTTKPKKRPGKEETGLFFPTSVLFQVFVYVLLTVGIFSDDPEALPLRDADNSVGIAATLLFLDQIKPIEQLVPVS